MKIRRHLTAIPILLFVLLGSSQPILAAQGGTVEAADGDVSTLVNAIRKANADPTPDNIILAAGGTYTLTEIADTSDGANGLMSITSPITIIGNGAVIERSDDPTTPAFRIFHVASAGFLTLDNVIIRGGLAAGEGSARFGGGILNDGRLDILNSTIGGNQAARNGGGIAHQPGGVLTITASTISGNSGFTGGGIHNRGTAFVYDSTITENQTSSHGGGIANSAAGTLTITGSTLASNVSDEFGGAIKNNGLLTIINSTFSGNRAMLSGGAIDSGGGILNRDEAPTTILHSTFSGNESRAGSAIVTTGLMTIQNTILAGSGDGAICATQVSISYEPDSMTTHEAEFTVIGQNFSTDDSCPGIPAVANEVLLLGPLADNGGPTQTHALLTGSPAIDAVPDCALVDAAPLTADQRGIARPQGATCDSGAYEAD